MGTGVGVGVAAGVVAGVEGEGGRAHELSISAKLRITIETDRRRFMCPQDDCCSSQRLFKRAAEPSVCDMNCSPFIEFRQYALLVSR